MTAQETKFVAAINKLISKGEKIPNSKFYTIGREYGLKFKEIGELKESEFAGLSRKKKTKTVAKKTEKKQKIENPEPAKSEKPEINEEDLEATGVVQDDSEAFVWIASEEEINSTEELHKVDY